MSTAVTSCINEKKDDSGMTVECFYPQKTRQVKNLYLLDVRNSLQ